MTPPLPAAGQVLGIFAKQPIASQAKTRLAQATSADWAQRVAQAFLEDSLNRLSLLPVQRVIVYAPSEASEFFQFLANGRFELLRQSDGDLGQRLRSFFAEYRRHCYARIVVVG